MKKFEYKTVQFDAKGLLGGKIDIEKFNAALNDLGKEGWELVDKTASAVGMGETKFMICVFKRELM